MSTAQRLSRGFHRLDFVISAALFLSVSAFMLVSAVDEANAAALITLMCLGENNARNSPLLTSLVIDMDKQTGAGDGIGCHNDQPCPITEVTESYIRFKVSDAWSGEISRISGALTVTRSTEDEWQTTYDLTCKPTYDRQDHTGTRHRRRSVH